MVLIGNELYFFKHRKDAKHTIMHCLTGTYLKEVNDDISDSNSYVSDVANSTKESTKSSVSSLNKKEIEY